MLVGHEDGHWDVCFIAEYPSVAAFVEMIKDPDYQRTVVHRQAAVETLAWSGCRRAPGQGFG